MGKKIPCRHKIADKIFTREIYSEGEKKIHEQDYAG